VIGAGRSAWDCALWTSGACHGAAVVACENRAQMLEYAERHASLLSPRILFVAPTPETAPATKTARWSCRDRLIGLLADRSALILLKDGGNMSAVLNELNARGCACSDYRDAMSKTRKRRAGPRASAAPCDPAIDAALAGRLAHYTRAPHQGQWPDETRAQYIQWLCSGARFEPRDEFNTLRHILKGRKLTASGELIPGGAPAVCFTAQTVAQIRAQRRWRRGLARWTFSSYGLAFEKLFLESCGAREVRYVDRTGTTPAPFVQVRSSAAGTWSDEREWRMLGDLNFSDLPANRIVAFCATETEAAALRAEFGVRALAIG
jgi:hypothetical protein